MEFKDNEPIYLQIADLFLENILSGQWNPGDRIPSVREMAMSIEVNPNTVMRTFTHLQEKEIIYNKRGIGYFVADDGLALTKSLKKDDFVKQELPEVFKTMDLLSLTLDDLKMYYESYKASSDR